MKSHTKLKPEERDRIAILKAQGKKVSEIARNLNRSPSTISDELKRNSWKKRPYIAIHAQYMSDKRRKSANKHNSLKSEKVYNYVLSKLRDGWSPELIAGRLKNKHPDDGSWWITHETIYSYIYDEKNKKFALWEYLPRKQRKRRKRSGRKVHKCNIADRVSIHERPEEVNKREEFGHWEADTVEGKGHIGGVHTEVERKSRLLRAVKVNRISSDEGIRAQWEIFKSLPEKCRRSTTHDNGKENHQHMQLHELGMKTYFCDPYSSWQRGTNEWHNGLLRRYFPKGTDFRGVDQSEIDDVVHEINSRPRKVLNFSTPYEVFKEELLNSS